MNRNAIPQDQVRKALNHLRRVDPVLGDVIRQVGPFKLRLERNRFRMLVRSIISQQISTSAARSIRLRFEKLLAPRRVTSQNVLRLTEQQMRAAGLSPQKTGYLLDLAGKIESNQLRLRRVGRMTDDDVIDELVQVKGVGRWTAQMFLIFCLGRLNVFPGDDLGIRAALRNLYELPELPDKATGHQIAEPWAPFATVASWYCWRSGDLPKTTRSEKSADPV